MTQNVSPADYSWICSLPITLIGFGIAGALSPIVSVVALPIFSAMASYHWLKSTYYSWGHQNTEKYGRIKGQDYTRWDGKSVRPLNKEQSKIERMHAEIGEHLHGREDKNFIDILRSNTPPFNYPFKTEEDLNWLNREVCRREAKDWLGTDLKMLRAFSKALIPFIGLLWVLKTEVLASDGACFIGCRVCMSGGMDAEDKHWSWDDALTFHQKLLSISLHKSQPEKNGPIKLGTTYVA